MLGARLVVGKLGRPAGDERPAHSAAAARAADTCAGRRIAPVLVIGVRRRLDDEVLGSRSRHRRGSASAALHRPTPSRRCVRHCASRGGRAARTGSANACRRLLSCIELLDAGVIVRCDIIDLANQMGRVLAARVRSGKARSCCDDRHRLTNDRRSAFLSADNLLACAHDQHGKSRCAPPSSGRLTTAPRDADGHAAAPGPTWTFESRRHWRNAG